VFRINCAEVAYEAAMTSQVGMVVVNAGKSLYYSVGYELKVVSLVTTLCLFDYLTAASIGFSDRVSKLFVMSVNIILQISVLY